MKILVINGSPRKNGNSVFLSQTASEVMIAEGADVKTINLSKMKIHPCVACDTCMKTGVNCVFKDDLEEIYEDIKSADGFIFASPVYWLSVSSYMKIFWDRMYGLYVNNEKFMDGKKAAIILTHADETMASGAANAYTTLKESFIFCGGEICESICGKCYNPGEVKNDERAIEEAKALGLDLVNKIKQSSK